MVTPLARRRPAKVARESAALDLLSAGRLVLGVGLGSDRFGEELGRFGEETDGRVRAAMIDESLTILKRAWTGTPVRHRGHHYRIDDVTFLPRSQQPSIPIWVAGFGETRSLFAERADTTASSRSILSIPTSWPRQSNRSLPNESTSPRHTTW